MKGLQLLVQNYGNPSCYHGNIIYILLFSLRSQHHPPVSSNLPVTDSPALSYTMVQDNQFPVTSTHVELKLVYLMCTFIHH